MSIKSYGCSLHAATAMAEIVILSVYGAKMTWAHVSAEPLVSSTCWRQTNQKSQIRSWMKMTESPMTIVSDLYLSERELAEALGLALQTLRMWRVQREGPPSTKIGRRVFYRREALTEWLKEQER